jgi:hypothetical protein
MLIQSDFKKLGYYTGAIDGKYGPATIKAIKLFQTKNNLAADGKIGPKTQTKLLEVLYGMSFKWLDKQTLIVTLPKAKLDVITNTKETVPSTYKKLSDKPLLLFNGGLFSGFNSMAETIDNGIVHSGVMSKYLLTDSGIIGMYWAMANNKVPKEGIGAGHLLVLDGKIHIYTIGYYKSLVNSYHTRLALGYNATHMTVAVVHGRRPNIGHKGCTIPQLAELMLKLGCDDAIGLDGGGSIYLINRYGRLLNQPTETRRVNHCIALRG